VTRHCRARPSLSSATVSRSIARPRRLFSDVTSKTPGAAPPAQFGDAHFDDPAQRAARVQAAVERRNLRKKQRRLVQAERTKQVRAELDELRDRLGAALANVDARDVEQQTQTLQDLYMDVAMMGLGTEYKRGFKNLGLFTF
jgi:hypothetical protein